MIRPFVAGAGVKNRGYSLCLQAAVSDFGKDMPFAHIREKVKRHYGVEIGTSAGYAITMRHARRMKPASTLPAARREASMLIGEMDGSMVPVVEMSKEEDVADLRKTRKVLWREMKLCLVREKGTVRPLFGATMGDAGQAGKVMGCVAKAAGFGALTHLHAVGDGAPWVSDQIEQQFGARSKYLIDFYHLCEYLAAAAKICSPLASSTWLAEQKVSLKTGDARAVLAALTPYCEDKEVPNDDAPVRACYRYIENRLHQLDYPRAIEQDLPIGSGEIESAHRYIIQERIKRPGAWWKPENAMDIFTLRLAAANGTWDQYWDNCRKNQLAA
jgi:hypothetical protein